MPGSKSPASPATNPSANDWENEGSAMDLNPDFVDEAYEEKQTDDGSMSISPRIFEHTFAHGRRYHKFLEGTYNFPNDPSEQEREELKHSMLINACGGKLHFAPIGKYPQNIIDLGTGTGIWCTESTSPCSLS